MVLILGDIMDQVIEIKSMENKIYTQDKIQELLYDVQQLVTDLGWDYERLTRGGKDIYDELCKKLNID